MLRWGWGWGGTCGDQAGLSPVAQAAVGVSPLRVPAVLRRQGRAAVRCPHSPLPSRSHDSHHGNMCLPSMSCKTHNLFKRINSMKGDAEPVSRALGGGGAAQRLVSI